MMKLMSGLFKILKTNDLAAATITATPPYDIQTVRLLDSKEGQVPRRRRTT